MWGSAGDRPLHPFIHQRLVAIAAATHRPSPERHSQYNISVEIGPEPKGQDYTQQQIQAPVAMGSPWQIGSRQGKRRGWAGHIPFRALLAANRLISP